MFEAGDLTWALFLSFDLDIFLSGMLSLKMSSGISLSAAFTADGVDAPLGS